MRDTEREAEYTQREAETQAEGEQAPCRKPDVGLDPGSPGSCPGRKAGAQPLSHPGIPLLAFSILVTNCWDMWNDILIPV